MVAEIDRIVAESMNAKASRSALVREALGEFLSRCARKEREAQDHRVYSDRREELARAARALIDDQAHP